MIFSETVGYFIFLFPVRSDLSVVAYLLCLFPEKERGHWFCTSVLYLFVTLFILSSHVLNNIFIFGGIFRLKLKRL